MKPICIFLCVLISNISLSFAQAVKLFHEKKDRGYILYASNPELYPVSVQIDFKLTNLALSEGDKTVFVIPSKTEKIKLAEMTVAEPGSRFSFNYTYKSTMGDVTITNYDKTVLYDLPFQKGKSYKVYQGYNGPFSHQNENSLDFTMPEGTEILAAREGLVVNVIQHNTEACPQAECKKYNNLISIMHPDGTFATYAHIKYNGAKCKVGDTVKRGDVIALSGNTGWTSGPHLHFVCFLGGFDRWNTIETTFKIKGGQESAMLKEGIIYERQY